MRHSRPSNAGGSSQRNGRGSNASQRARSVLDSPPRLKYQRSGPSMSAERFLFIVGDLQNRAQELWEVEQAELQRGAELMVICCSGSPSSPQHQVETPTARQSIKVQEPESPAVVFYEGTSLHQPSHVVIGSPSLITAPAPLTSPRTLLTSPRTLIHPPAQLLNSPTSWIATARSLGLDAHVQETADEPAAGAGHAPLPQWHMGHGHDGEVLISLLGSSCGGSATARAAKARLVDKFDSGCGTATARQAQNANPFAPDDFLGSPTWASSAYL